MPAEARKLHAELGPKDHPLKKGWVRSKVYELGLSLMQSEQNTTEEESKFKSPHSTTHAQML